MPTKQCSDGSLGGNTGRCLKHEDGKCGWEIRACPPAKGAAAKGLHPFATIARR
jgi:hypothetical protein